MFGLTRREQRWKAEQQAAEALIPMITAIKVEAMKQNDKDATIERLTAEVAGLREKLELAEVVRASQVEGLAQGAGILRDERDALRAEVAGLREDALRYRYLRHVSRQECLVLDGPEAGVWCDCENEHGDLVLLTEGDLDAAIDAALAARKGEA